MSTVRYLYATPAVGAPRHAALDGLRALAILGVLLCHAQAALGGRWSTALAWGVAVWAAAWVLTMAVERPVGRWIAGAPK